MRGTKAFLRKEMLALKRSRSFYIALGVFLLFGLMNPLLTILTPILFEILAPQMEEIGMSIGVIEASSSLCWQEFSENFSMMLIVFVIMYAGIMTSEYRRGTLILVLTKGMSKKGIYLSKLVSVLLVWTLGYIGMTAVTLIFSACLWDNSEVCHLPAVIIVMWLSGVMLCCLIMCFSAFFKGMAQVLVGTGAVVFVCLILGIIPGAAKYLPTSLMETSSVMAGYSEIGIPSVLITVAICVVSTALGFWKFEKKEI